MKQRGKSPKLSGHQAMQRRIRLNLRRTVRVHRRLDVTYLGEGRERLTCRECGHVQEQTVGNMDLSRVDLKTAEKLGRYRAEPNGGGITGECPRCTKAVRDERFPLKGAES